MGSKKPTVRTLPTGERATHYPDGRVVLIPADAARSRFEAAQQELHDAHATLRNRDELTKMRERMKSKGVPSDKLPI